MCARACAQWVGGSGGIGPGLKFEKCERERERGVRVDWRGESWMLELLMHLEIDTRGC